jgi:hypothetical protein
MHMVRLFPWTRLIALRRHSREEAVDSDDEEWNEFAREWKERALVIASETGIARDTVLARRDSPEAAHDELVALYQYSAGRMAMARELLERRRFGERAWPIRAGFSECDTRIAVIRAEGRLASSRILATLAIAHRAGQPSDESYGWFRSEMEAAADYTHGQLDAVFEREAARRGRRWSSPWRHESRTP